MDRLAETWMDKAVAMPLVRFGVPISLMGLLLKGGIHWSMAMNALIAALAIGLWMLGLQRLPREAKQLIAQPCRSVVRWAIPPISASLSPSLCCRVRPCRSASATTSAPPFWPGAWAPSG